MPPSSIPPAATKTTSGAICRANSTRPSAILALWETKTRPTVMAPPRRWRRRPPAPAAGWEGAGVSVPDRPFAQVAGAPLARDERLGRHAPRSAASAAASKDLAASPAAAGGIGGIDRGGPRVDHGLVTAFGLAPEHDPVPCRLERSATAPRRVRPRPRAGRLQVRGSVQRPRRPADRGDQRRRHELEPRPGMSGGKPSSLGMTAEKPRSMFSPWSPSPISRSRVISSTRWAAMTAALRRHRSGPVDIQAHGQGPSAGQRSGRGRPTVRSSRRRACSTEIDMPCISSDVM